MSRKSLLELQSDLVKSILADGDTRKVIQSNNPFLLVADGMLYAGQFPDTPKGELCRFLIMRSGVAAGLYAVRKYLMMLPVYRWTGLLVYDAVYDLPDTNLTPLVESVLEDYGVDLDTVLRSRSALFWIVAIALSKNVGGEVSLWGAYLEAVNEIFNVFDSVKL